MLHSKEHLLANTKLVQKTIVEQDYLFDSFFGAPLVIKPKEELSISSLDLSSLIDLEDKSIQSLRSSNQHDQKEDLDKKVSTKNSGWQPEFESSPPSEASRDYQKSIR